MANDEKPQRVKNAQIPYRLAFSPNRIQGILELTEYAAPRREARGAIPLSWRSCFYQGCDALWAMS